MPQAESSGSSRAPSPFALSQIWASFGRHGRFRHWLLLALVYLAVSLITRMVLWGVASYQGQTGGADLPGLMLVGAVYDLAALSSLLLPFGIYLALIPHRMFVAAWHRYLMALMFCLTAFGVIYLGAVEFFFFDEFNSRFNFVAVEYLIYPHEVFVNIWQSYPVGQMLLATFLLTAWLVWRLRHDLRGTDGMAHHMGGRLVVLAVMFLTVGIGWAGLDINTGRYSENRLVNELAMNGAYAFFSAAMSSELDYAQYYLSLPDDESDARLQKVLRSRHAAYFPDADHIERHVAASGPPRNLHVVVLLEESLGAEFVGAYGDSRGLTPNIDRLAKESLLFTRTYATGTRTVRGMEAVSASFPPVPAESIVKRPRNEGMFNWSTVMAKKGYSPTFIYGGYGTFDNMNYFFGNNGYRVIDRTDMDKPKFGNIWGVSDEDLFRNAARVFDEQHGRGENIFSIIMTTSNHKPFTFPPGVPGVPEEGGGRNAGVQYADCAIGKFFELATTRPWFEDTIFVVVADHGARVYGREDIPIATYEIPLLIYSPKHVKPRKVDALTSLMDVAPTVLGLLNAGYDSTFFGIDVLNDDHAGRLIPLNHNRDIALFDGRNLVQLGFRKTSAQYTYDLQTRTQTRVPTDPELLKDTISVFQEAYEMYHEQDYRIKEGS
jgi:phosphoglycerol transferase MdoB-like AlkP superfamily enzyme